MSKHTPGPWTATYTRVGGEVAAFSICAKEYGSLNPICEGSFGFSDDMEANAHLIAAAPEMLSELRGVLEWARVEKAPLRQIEIDSIAALIAKAEGRK